MDWLSLYSENWLGNHILDSVFTSKRGGHPARLIVMQIIGSNEQPDVFFEGFQMSGRACDVGKVNKPTRWFVYSKRLLFA